MTDKNLSENINLNDISNNTFLSEDYFTLNNNERD